MKYLKDQKGDAELGRMTREASIIHAKYSKMIEIIDKEKMANAAILARALKDVHSGRPLVHKPGMMTAGFERVFIKLELIPAMVKAHLSGESDIEQLMLKGGKDDTNI